MGRRPQEFPCPSAAGVGGRARHTGTVIGSRRRRRVAGTLIAAFALGACADGADVGGAQARAEAVQGGICEAAESAPRDTGDAQDAFDRVHTDLHLLAAETEERDRAATARLLQAKQQVEADLRDGVDGDRLAIHLDALGVQLAEAVQATDLATVSTCS